MRECLIWFFLITSLPLEGLLLKPNENSVITQQPLATKTEESQALLSVCIISFNPWDRSDLASYFFLSAQLPTPVQAYQPLSDSYYRPAPPQSPCIHLPTAWNAHLPSGLNLKPDPAIKNHNILHSSPCLAHTPVCPTPCFILPYRTYNYPTYYMIYLIGSLPCARRRTSREMKNRAWYMADAQ